MRQGANAGFEHIQQCDALSKHVNQNTLIVAFMQGAHAGASCKGLMPGPYVGASCKCITKRISIRNLTQIICVALAMALCKSRSPSRRSQLCLI